MAERRLAAIMFTDIVGYTALMAESEEKGLRVRRRHRQVLRPLVERYHGEWVQDVGDETLSSFPSAADAVNCALAIQATLRGDPELKVRTGIHLGDVVLEEGSLHGDGINVASRIRPLAEAGGICVSGEVYKSIRNQPRIEAVSLGERELKNVPEPVAVYSISGKADPPWTVSWTVPALRTARRWPIQAVAILLVIALGVAWWIIRPSAELPPIRSIAVLPLENLSGDPEQEYFADGMTEALISNLATIRSLRVISRTSVMQYKGVRRSLPEIAEELNVDAVIEGTVLREDERVRITAQLIDARNDSHLWVQSYERDLRGVLALQSEIARAIAEQVRVKLTPEETTRLAESRPVDPEAHEAYLKGRYYLAKFTGDDAGRAIEHFEEAIRIDPEYAPAHAGLSISYKNMGGALMGLPPRHAMPKAKAAALRALDLDDGLASGHHALGSALFYFDWDWDGAEKEFQRAIALDPSLAAAHYGYAQYLSAMGRDREAIEKAQRAVEVAPLDLFARTELAQAFFFARDYDRGVQEVREVLELDPDYPRAHQWLSWLYELLGRYEEAVDARAKMATLADAELAGEVQAIRAAYETDGPEGYWRALIQHQEREARITRLAPMHFVWAYALLGDADQAFAWLDRAYEVRNYDLVFLQTDPTLDSIRSDPRFDDLLRRIGFPES